MKKFYLLSILAVVLAIAVFISKSAETDEYIVIAWNDLGMHCSNKDFSTLVVLPPYNNLKAQVIKRGSESSLPQIVTIGIKVTYEIPGNTYSVGKTNFWDYSQQLFGTQLAPNIGLKGAGLSGDMTANGNFFLVEGIPITPYTDADLVNEDPYQQALVKVFDLDGNLLASTKPVIPVSNEIGCVSSGCHSSEQSILNQHEQEGGFNPNNKPILCASCHASNALGTTGQSEAMPLSYRIHNKHASRTSDCYKCHPGPNTKCFRDVMFSAGKQCTDCHGNLSQIASSINSGRRPWLDEPSCDKSGCHNSSHAPNSGKLFKDSQGHGGMFCSACHGSPHAIYPTVNERDNEQMIALQGFAGKLSECWVCHGYMLGGTGPHGIEYTNVKEGPDRMAIRIYPNPVNDILYIYSDLSDKDVKIYNIKGNLIDVSNLLENRTENEIRLNAGNLPKGTYILKIGNKSKKFVKN